MVASKPLVWFTFSAFGLAWPLFLLPVLFGPPGSPARQIATPVAWSLAMWAPGLAALLATRYAARESLGALNLRRLGPRRYYLWAWLLPPALALATGLLTWLLGAGRLDLEFTALRAALEQAPAGPAISPGLLAGLQIALALTPR